MGGTLYVRPNVKADVPNVSGLMRSDADSIHTKTAKVFLETFLGLTHLVGSIQCEDNRTSNLEELRHAGDIRIRKDYTILFGTPKSNINNSYFETKLFIGTVNALPSRPGSVVKVATNFILSIGLNVGFKSADFVQKHPEPIFEIKNGKSFPPGDQLICMRPCMVDDYGTPHTDQRKIGVEFISAMNPYLGTLSIQRFRSDVIRDMFIYSVKLSQVLRIQLDEMTKDIKRSETEYMEAINNGPILKH